MQCHRLNLKNLNGLNFAIDAADVSLHRHGCDCGHRTSRCCRCRSLVPLSLLPLGTREKSWIQDCTMAQLADDVCPSVTFFHVLFVFDFCIFVEYYLKPSSPLLSWFHVSPCLSRPFMCHVWFHLSFQSSWFVIVFNLFCTFFHLLALFISVPLICFSSMSLYYLQCVFVCVLLHGFASFSSYCISFCHFSLSFVHLATIVTIRFCLSNSIILIYFSCGKTCHTRPSNYRQDLRGIEPSHGPVRDPKEGETQRNGAGMASRTPLKPLGHFQCRRLLHVRNIVNYQ